MLEKYRIRTDLALEEKERFDDDNVEIKGVVVEEDYDEEKEIRVTKVLIQTEKAAKTMGRPVGTYLTIEAAHMTVPDDAKGEGRICRPHSWTWKQGGHSGCFGAVCGRSSLDYKACGDGVREICHGGGKNTIDQCDRTWRHGTDRYGDIGDRQRDRK